MSYGYLGDTSTKINQKVKNNGVISVNENLDLESKGHAGGSLEFITSTSFTNSTAILTTLKEDIYDVHYFELLLTGAHQDITIFLDMSTDGGSSYVNDDLAYSKSYGQSNSTFNQSTNADLYGIQVAQSVDSNNGCYCNGYLYYLGNSSQRSHYSGFSVFERSGDSDVRRFEYGGGVYRTAGTINAIKFYPNQGGLTGSLKLYGIKQ